MRFQAVSAGLQDLSHFGNATIAGANLTEGEGAIINACRGSYCCCLDKKVCRLVELAALSRLLEV